MRLHKEVISTRQIIEEINGYVLREHLFHRRRLRHQAPDLDVLNQVAAFHPVAFLQSLARLHDMISRALRRSSEHLAVGKFQEPPERLRDNPALLLLIVRGRKHGNLNEHARHQKRRFQELCVDMHVERQLPLSLGLLLLGRQGLEALLMHTLCKQLLHSLSVEDVLQRRLRLTNETNTESSETDLYNCTVVQYLSNHVRVVDLLLQMRH